MKTRPTTSDLTPMMRQYLDIKEKQRDAILFFRLGDFYEMFFDDALEATRILHITLTSRDGGKGKKVPMCGVPHHAANNYIARLIKHGRKVAICEQVEEASQGKGLVKRDITRIITPGTFVADEILDSSVNNYILSVNLRDEAYGLAYADISTGEFRMTEIRDRETALSELCKISPAECLLPESLSEADNFRDFREVNLGTVTLEEDWAFDSELSAGEIKRHFSVDTLEGFGCGDTPAALGAAGALLKYLKETQRSALKNIVAISSYRTGGYMLLDRNSQRHLELVRNQEDLSTTGTLLEAVDLTCTPMGRRELKRWILNPLIDPPRINRRLDSVEFMYHDNIRRESIRELLNDMYDIERLSNKMSVGTANGRDMVCLSTSLKKITRLKQLKNGDEPERLGSILEEIEDFSGLYREIDKCIEEDPPLTIREGGLIRKGFNAEVDELRTLITDGRDWVAALQKQEAERTGISSLKIGYNRVFGYYIEVTKANLGGVPEDYVRKQTLANAERFITQELKEQESRIIGAQERIKQLEYEIFRDMRDKVGARIARLKKTAMLIAELDVLSDLAEVAAKNGYTRPIVSDKSFIRVSDGRHPVLERVLRDKEFVPNDLEMDSDGDRIFIITGSNMAGKSTFIRQTALITVMAQMGGFVPAAKAEIGVVDRVFTRVGASDRLYRGMSTFMVEMLETASILNNATHRSLIILDEIGRGTSTFDGVSIAWAVVEYIHHKLAGAKAMFATHYHELTELTGMMEGVNNYHLAVQEWGEDIIFLYKVKKGSCDESFGIHVARLAGMPKEVIKRSREILENLQKDSLLGNIRSKFAEQKEPGEGRQLDLFETKYEEHPLLNEIRAIDLDNMTPVEALGKLAELKEGLGE